MKIGVVGVTDDMASSARTPLRWRTRVLTVVASLGLLMAASMVGTPSQATFPGSNGKLIFQALTQGCCTGYWDLWVASPDAVQDAVVLRELWQFPGGALFSPDGQRIVFSERAEGADPATSIQGNLEIFIMNADGSQPRQLTHTSDIDNQTAGFSPDGKQLLFVQRLGYDGYRLMIMDVDGTNQRELMRAHAIGGPKWSPDGTEISFAGIRRYGDPSGLWVVPSDGVGPRLLAEGTLSGGDWSPDSSTLVFGNNTGELWKIDVNTGAQTQLSFPPGEDFKDYAAKWSPDGAKIVFIRAQFFSNSGTYDPEIYLMSSSGGNVEQLSFNYGRGEESIDWQPLCSGVCTIPTWQHTSQTHDRGLTFSMGPALHAAGRLFVDDRLYECRDGQVIKLQRKVGPRWKTIDRDEVDVEGRYEVYASENSYVPGRWTYRTVAARSVIGLYENHTCAKAISSTLRRG